MTSSSWPPWAKAGAVGNIETAAIPDSDAMAERHASASGLVRFVMMNSPLDPLDLLLC